MIHRLRLILLAASMLAFCGVANAELVGTDEAAASLEPAKPDADREKLRAFSDKEVHVIAGKVDMLPAGGRLTNNDLLLIVVIILAVVVLIIVL